MIVTLNEEGEIMTDNGFFVYSTRPTKWEEENARAIKDSHDEWYEWTDGRLITLCYDPKEVGKQMSNYIQYMRSHYNAY